VNLFRGDPLSSLLWTTSVVHDGWLCGILTTKMEEKYMKNSQMLPDKGEIKDGGQEIDTLMLMKINKKIILL